MSRLCARFALCSLLSVAPVTAARSPAGDDPAAADANPLIAAHPIFRDSVARIAQGSPLFRRAIDLLQGTGRRILIVTPGQLRSMEWASLVGHGAVEGSWLAETTPLLDADHQVRAAVVVVNLGLLEKVHTDKGSLLAELYSDIDRILVHELYGHALPYLSTGDLSGRCADPGPGERPSEACAIRRENEVRAELRLGKRVDSGLEGLTLSRRTR